jgi:hypothetical protein
MEASKLIDQILLSANEDYCGLWDIYFEASAIFEKLPPMEQLRIAKETILELVNAGWIQLYWCREPLTNERVTPMNHNDAAKVLSEDQFWKLPENNALSIRFLATTEGEKAFAKRFLK